MPMDANKDAVVDQPAVRAFLVAVVAPGGKLS